MANQFMTKRWNLEKLLAKREGLAFNVQSTGRPEFKRLLEEVNEAVKLRIDRGETWDKYWSRDKGDWVTFKDHVEEIKKNAPPLTAEEEEAVKQAQRFVDMFC